MSRKKKKKNKKQIEQQQDQKSLNGWNCPAAEIVENDGESDDGDDELDDEIGDELDYEPDNAPEPAPDMPPDSGQVTGLDNEPYTPPPRHLPQGELNTGTASGTNTPWDKPRKKRADDWEQPTLFHMEDKPNRQPMYIREETAPAEATVAEESEPMYIRKETAPAEATVVEETATRYIRQEDTTKEATPAEPIKSGSLADDIKNRTADRLAKSKDGLLKLFTQPRKPQSELEEDIIKFGGLEDEPQEEADRPEAYKRMLEKLRAMSPRGKKPPKAEKRTENLSAQQEQTIDGPMVGYARDTYIWGYTECYYIGIQVLRNASDLRRRLFGISAWARYNIPYFVRTKRRQIARVLDAITDSCLHPFRDISAKTRGMRITVSRIYSLQPENKLEDSAKTFFRYLYSLGKPINSIASFILPILGCAVLATAVLYFQQLNYALEVEFSGVQLGYVASEGDFYTAKNAVYDRLINEEYAPPDDSRPTFRLVIVDPDKLTTTEELTNKIMAISKNEVAMADGVYIDGAFLGAVEDGSEFLFYIDSILDNYRTDTAHERVQFVKKVGLQRGMYPVSSIRPVHEIKNALENNESLPQTHTVVEGETLETIAVSNNTTVDDIVKLNTNLETRMEQNNGEVPNVITGESILVNRVELSLGIQVTRREEYEEEIDYGTDYTENNKELDGVTWVISNGVKGERQIVADITYVDGERVNESIVERNVISEPVNARVMRGTLKPAEFLPAGGGDSTASFIWPVAGGYVSAGLYGYYGHTGMDIAAPQGTGIYAARSGTVTYASNKNVWPYGRRVNISHGDGVTSMYAHCSEVLVQYGQYVEQGQLIAKIGRTGNASGNHLHIEIKINGRIMNPADFIGKG